MSTETRDPFEYALDYTRSEYHEKLSLRDQMASLARERSSAGDIVNALTAQLQGAAFDGECSGLSLAITQLQMVRERLDESSEADAAVARGDL